MLVTLKHFCLGHDLGSLCSLHLKESEPSNLSISSLCSAVVGYSDRQTHLILQCVEALDNPACLSKKDNPQSIPKCKEQGDKFPKFKVQLLPPTTVHSNLPNPIPNYNFKYTTLRIATIVMEAFEETDAGLEKAMGLIDETLDKEGLHGLRLDTSRHVLARAKMVSHGLRSAQKRRNNAIVVYLVSSVIERQLANGALEQEPLEAGLPAPGKVGVLTYTEFVQRVGKDTLREFPDDLVILADSELSFSYEAAIAHKVIAYHARSVREARKQSVHLITFTILSSHAYERQAYHGTGLEEVSHQVDKRSALRHAEVVEFTAGSDSNTAVFKAALDCIRNGKTVVSFLDPVLTEDIMLRAYRLLLTEPNVQRPKHRTLVSDMAAVQVTGVFGPPFNSNSTWVTVSAFTSSHVLPIVNVGMVLSGIEVPRFVAADFARGGLLVKEGRQYSVPEMVLQHLYVTGASPVCTRDRIFCMYSPEELSELPSLAPQRFLNGEIMQFLVEAVYRWPRHPLLTLSVRMRPDEVRVLAEMVRRLVRMGVVEPTGPGFALTGSKGVRLRNSLLPMFPDGFNACVLLSGLDGLPVRVQRVLIRAGAVAMYADSLIESRVEEMTSQDFLEIQTDCHGVGKLLSPQGNLWVMLGLYDKAMILSGNLERPLPLLAGNRVCLSEAAVRNVADTVDRIEGLYHLSPTNAAAQPLSDADKRNMSSHLMRAWFDKLVFLRRSGNNAFDLLSLEAVEIDWRDFFDPVVFWNSRPNPNADDGVLGFALAMEHWADDEEDPNKIGAMAVTLLPRELIQQVMEETRSGAVDAFVSKYLLADE
ncbi:uncharacterized protein E0L32_001139 [Thyridium curvatum]|uniref:Uncharacterized protein n=1 Tax=Thyridium curvatum TaxID=1093900 RepID=A0A507B2L9_9PEZI|nr:uncharacterized protein E0L32_001139 [Thyridium curvatum]TPX11321.1 hypothetical protein E0L32_001139 [Thyridium curvatum]